MCDSVRELLRRRCEEKPAMITGKHTRGKKFAIFLILPCISVLSFPKLAFLIATELPQIMEQAFRNLNIYRF
jgi:hypothetical protein